MHVLDECLGALNENSGPQGFVPGVGFINISI